jgi:hypothetical protein
MADCDNHGSDKSDEAITHELKNVLVALQRVVEECQRSREEIEAALAGDEAARKYVVGHAAVLVIDDQPNYLVDGKNKPVNVG